MVPDLFAEMLYRVSRGESPPQTLPEPYRHVAVSAASFVNGKRAQHISDGLRRVGSQEALEVLRIFSRMDDGALRTEDVADLAEREIAPMRWSVEGLIPEGAVLLGGRPKMGKSFLALQAAEAVANGEPFLGRATQQGTVLYLALEDNDRRMKERLRNNWAGRRGRLHTAYDCPHWADGGEKQIRRWLTEHPQARMVVIDTWGRVAPAQKGRGESYTEVYGVQAQVQAVALDHHVTVILVTHTRKPVVGGDYLDAILGSTAIPGSADAILVLERDRHSEAAVLYGTGRDLGETQVRLMQEQGGGWRLQTDEDFLRADSVGRAILDLLAREPQWYGTTGELFRQVGGAQNAVSLGRRLGQLRGAFEGAGIEVSQHRKTAGVFVTLRRVGSA